MSKASASSKLGLSGSTGPEPHISGFTPINSSSDLKNENPKLPHEDWNHGFLEEPSTLSTPGKRKRAEFSKTPRRPISSIAKLRQPQKGGDFNPSRNQDLYESQSDERPLSIATQNLEHNISAPSQLTPQEPDEPNHDMNLDGIWNFDSIIRGSIWPEETVSDYGADDFIPPECFEPTTLDVAIQAGGHEKSRKIEGNWQPSLEGWNDNFEEASLNKEVPKCRSSNVFPDYPPENLLELRKYDGISLDDAFDFDTLIDDFSWNENASFVWGDDDECALDKDDVLDIMQLAEVEKVMTVAEGNAIAEDSDAVEGLPSLSTESACMIESNADDLWEVDDLFIESLQSDLTDSEPQENGTGNGSLAISSAQPAQKSSPCSRHPGSVGGVHSESLYDDEDLERELLNLGASAFSSVEGPSSFTPPSSPVPVSSPKPLTVEKPKLQPDIPHLISFDADGKPLPFIRQPFAKSVRDRPVIHALRSESVLRTCFRIGEALNAASAALNSGIDSIVELYARVSSSTREQKPSSSKQHFQFADLFTPDKPPFLTGVYTLWRGVKLWDHGSKVFLGKAGKGKMARVVGRMRKEEGGMGSLMMVVLCVWQVDWEEVGLAKGVVCS